ADDRGGVMALLCVGWCAGHDACARRAMHTRTGRSRALRRLEQRRAAAREEAERSERKGATDEEGREEDR
ncbi:MAG: hypothetical protein SOZ99_10960, partial [Paraeggerthella sp.]|nr:hypothetical protein [Paraeggerthella sp.]